MSLAAVERILGRVAVVGECWVFQGCLTKDGYGQVHIGRRVVLTHRLVYESLVGPIPDGLTIDHVAARGCSSRACGRPSHLEPVPNVVNVMRGNGPPARNARMVVCKRGHPFTQFVNQRACLTCRRESNRESARRRREMSAEPVVAEAVSP